MTSIFDVARYILHKSGEMSIWKLQKLCWYALAWHGAWTGKVLFRENFEAWKNGPVCPALFECHCELSISEINLPDDKQKELNKEEKESIDIVLNAYNDFDAYDLKEIVRLSSPYCSVRQEWEAQQKQDAAEERPFSGPVIPKKEIFRYYQHLQAEVEKFNL